MGLIEETIPMRINRADLIEKDIIGGDLIDTGNPERS